MGAIYTIENHDDRWYTHTITVLLDETAKKRLHFASGTSKEGAIEDMEEQLTVEECIAGPFVEVTRGVLDAEEARRMKIARSEFHYRAPYQAASFDELRERAG